MFVNHCGFGSSGVEQQKLIDWLKGDFENFRDEIKRDLEKIQQDVSEIKKFKWQIVGGSFVVSAIVGIIIQFILGMK